MLTLTDQAAISIIHIFDACPNSKFTKLYKEERLFIRLGLTDAGLYF